MKSISPVQQRFFHICALVGLLSFVVSAQAAKSEPAAKAAAAKSTDTVIMKVNGKPVTQGEYDATLNQLVLMQMQSMMKSGGEVPTTASEQLRQEMKSTARDQLIGNTLMDQAIEKQVGKVSDKAVEAEINKLNKAMKGAGTTIEAEIAKSKDRGMTMAEVKRQLRNQLAAVAVIEREVGSIAPTEEEVKKYYEENKAKLGQPEQFRVSMIVFADPKTIKDPSFTPTQQEMQTLKQKAEAVVKEAKSGKDFAKLAKEHSVEPETAAKGGDIGFIPKGQFPPEIEATIDRLKVGEVSGLIETKQVLYIAKLTDHKAAKPVSFAEVKEGIFNMLKMNNMREATPLAITKMVGKAKIEDLTGAPAGKPAKGTPKK